MQTFAALITGFIFGIGLLISGMANPAKVQNFLDLFGTWDPSLAFVMGGAIAVTMPGYWLVRKRAGPVLGDLFHLPTRSDIDARLVAGSGLFGIGWALGGFCPGPAIASVSLLAPGTLVFVGAMIAGMWLAKITGNMGAPSPEAQGL